jgi:beta-glucanase (GH16 family)
MSRTKIYKALFGLLLFLAPFAFILPEISHAQPQAAPGDILFFDDFNGTSIDTAKWFPGLHQWGSSNRGVVPQNLSVHSYNDNGNTINVLDTEAHGDQYTGSVMGILSTNSSYPIGDPRRYTTQTTGTRVGGLVWTQARWGGGRYEVRMKNLPLSGGCSCIWNYYEPAAGDYTEIDIEMPANGHANDANWFNWAGLNTYFPSPADADAVYQNVNLGFAQNDGNFHIYRWDWYDGINGPKKIEWYVDGVLKATATNHVPSSPAQLWVGNWPAIWSGNFQYNTQHLYIDWVKITELGNGPTVTPTRTNTPSGPTNTPTATPTRTNTPTGPTNTPTNTPPSGSNLLTNPGFETGTAAARRRLRPQIPRAALTTCA